MDTIFMMPPDNPNALQRLLPYMTPELRNDQRNLEAILLFFKLGGDKLARIAIDAFNQTQRLKNAQALKLRLKASMMDEQLDEDEDKDDDDKDDGLNIPDDDTDDNY